MKWIYTAVCFLAFAILFAQSQLVKINYLDSTEHTLGLVDPFVTYENSVEKCVIKCAVNVTGCLGGIFHVSSQRCYSLSRLRMSPNVWSEAISFVILRNDELICPNNFTQIVISRGGSNNDDRERHDDLIQVPLQIGQIPNTDDRPPAPLDNNRQWIWNDLEERWKPNKGPDMKYINGQWIEIP